MFSPRFAFGPHNLKAIMTNHTLFITIKQFSTTHNSAIQASKVRGDDARQPADISLQRQRTSFRGEQVTKRMKIACWSLARPVAHAFRRHYCHKPVSYCTAGAYLVAATAIFLRTCNISAL